MEFTLKNGLVYQNGIFTKVDLHIKDGLIAAIGSPNFFKASAGDIDCKNLHIVPGFIDIHVHLREPGFEHKETIASGSRAAAKGGFTTICAMPNTNPVMDSAEVVEKFYIQAAKTAKVHVRTYAAITKALKTDELVDFEKLKAAGCIAFTNDGVGVQTANTMYQAMHDAKKLNMAVVAHCEDNSLIWGGAVHYGDVSKRLDIRGIPNICESVQIARDVLLAEASGCHYHVCHVSTKESVRVIRDAKKAGIHVSAEVSPHHLILSEGDITTVNTAFKMNPPLRSKADRAALIAGLEDGTIDCIATDHAPHHEDEKAHDIDKAPFGIIGLEDAFSLLYTEFVLTQKWTLAQLISWLTEKPAAIFNFNTGTLEAGKPADITILDLSKSAKIGKPFASLASNTPFIGKKVTGLPVQTIVSGEIVYKRK